MELLEGTDGRKMSSSWGNVVNLTDTAREMVFKIMALPDDLIRKYFVFTTRLSLEKIEEILTEITHPRELKLRLAEEVAALYTSRGEAQAACQAWMDEVSEKKLPDDILVVEIPSGEYDLVTLVIASGLVSSKSEVRRLANQDGVKINGEVCREGVFEFPLDEKILLSVGKKNHVYLK
jgi:tyrosyl-tRNA synthetase